MIPGHNLKRDSREALQNPRLQASLLNVTNLLMDKRKDAFAQVEDSDKLCQLAREIREETIHHLDKYLGQLEEKVRQAGGTVHWAKTAQEARRIVLEIAQKNSVKLAVKSKSMISEEIELNETLEHHGIEVVETDLGEFIIQLAKEKPFHIIVPAIHKTTEQVAELFKKKLGEESPADAQALASVARKVLRKKFAEAQMGITGVNFAVAETGTVTLVTNEGNGRFVTTLPKVHVALMGMERLAPRLKDLAVLLRVLARSATGQKLTVYTSFFTGPRRPGELDGAQEFHLVVLDNGRSHLLGSDFEEVLYCIRCGACLNICPVYQKIGGHAYGSVYPGPIGSILTPALDGIEPAKEMYQASSLCGACRGNCPVKIDIPKFLLANRERLVQAKKTPLVEKLMFVAWSFFTRNPFAYRLNHRLGYWLMRLVSKNGFISWLPFPVSGWTRYRDLRAIAKTSFRERWKTTIKKPGAGEAA